MSLQYRSSDGTETPVAGLAPAGQLVPSVSLYQSGTTAFEVIGAFENASENVVFQTPMPDTDYEVSLSISNSIFVGLSIDNKTVNGFRVYAYRPVDEATPIAPIVKWTAFKLMTNEDRALDEAKIAQNTANFAPAFSTTTSYAVGDYVTYGGVLYKCTTAHTAGVWVAGHFTQVTVGGQLKVQDISSSITRGDGYASGQIHVFRDGNTVQVIFNSVMTTGYSKTICSGLPRPLHISYFCVQADEVPQELGLGSLLENGSIVTGAETAGMGPSKIWDGFITYLTRD